MKTKSSLNANILKIIQKIRDEFPELSKYIGEMPVKISDNEPENIKNLEDYYDSLNQLFKKYAIEHDDIYKKENTEMKNNVEGYPLYPASDDIYNKSKELTDLNPEDITKKKSPNEKPGTMNEKGFENRMSGDDLDIPGSELDDKQEKIGSEDEENNYYSLGGNHNDLEEDKG